MECTAVLPVMEVDSGITGRRGVSLPFSDECAAIGSDVSRINLVSAVLNHGKTRRWKYCDFHGGKHLFAGAVASCSFWGHRLELTSDITSLFGSFHSSARRAIRKAEQSRVTVEFSTTLKAVRSFYEMFCHTRKKHGIPPQPWRFFENIQRHVLASDQGFVALARHAGAHIAGAIFFCFGKTSLLKFSASDFTFQHLRGNNLVMWNAIRRMAQNGISSLDLGRTSLSNEGLRHFKLSWGTRERLVEYVRYDHRVGQFVQLADKATGWHTIMLRHFPTPLFRLIGSIIYRHTA